MNEPTQPATPETPVVTPGPIGTPQAPTPAPAPPSAPEAPDKPQGQAPVVQPGNSEPKTPVEGNTPVEPPKDPAALEFKVPEEYKDRPWAKKITSEAELYKQLDNLDKAVGKKAVPPDLATATPEDREAFYAQMRPKDVAEYKFTEGVAIDPNMEKGVRDMLAANGISATQGNEVIKAFQTQEQAAVAEMYNPEGMKTALESAFGKDWDKVTKATRTLLKGVMAPEDQAALDHLPNPYLSIIYRTLGNVTKAYGITETNMAHMGDGGSVAPVDITSVRNGLRDQMRSLSTKPHTSAEMQDLKNKLSATYKNDPRLPR